MKSLQKNNTMKYIVTVREVHAFCVKIEADSEEQAKNLAKDEINANGIPDYTDLEYSYTLPSENWDVNLA